MFLNALGLEFLSTVFTFQKPSKCLLSIVVFSTSAARGGHDESQVVGVRVTSGEDDTTNRDGNIKKPPIPYTLMLQHTLTHP
jgi:hypothetical protein